MPLISILSWFPLCPWAHLCIYSLCNTRKYYCLNTRPPLFIISSHLSGRWEESAEAFRAPAAAATSYLLPGWCCCWLWTAAQLVFWVCVCVCVRALSNRKFLMWLSLPKAAALSAAELDFFPSRSLSRSFSYILCCLSSLFLFHHACSLSALAQELWMWSPAACCIADRDDEHTDLSPHIQTQLKARKKRIFFSPVALSHSSLV